MNIRISGQMRTVDALLVEHRGYAVAMLGILAMLHAMDRMILSVLVVPIQQELGINDAAMGTLTGGGFAVVYALCVVPLAG